MDELVRVNELFRSMVNDAKTHMVVTDTNGVVRFANRAASRITGYSYGEIIGNTPRLWGGMLTPTFYKQLWERKQQGIGYSGEITNRRKDHTLYTALAKISPIYHDDGTLIGYLGLEEDIIELKQQTRRLEKLNKFMVGRELRMKEMKGKMKHFQKESPDYLV